MQFWFSQFFFKMHLEKKICRIELVFDFWVIFAAATPPPVWRIYLFFGFLASKNLVLLFDFAVESFHVNFMIFWVSSTSVKKKKVILINFRSFVYWKAISIFSIFLQNASGEQNLPNWTGFWFLSYFCCCCSSSCVKSLFIFWLFG